MSTYTDRIDTLADADRAAAETATRQIADAARQTLTDRTAVALVEATARAIIRHGTSEYNYGIHRQDQLKAALKLADLLVPDSWSRETLATAWQQLTDANYIA